MVLYCCHLLKSSLAVLYCRSSILGKFCDRGSTGIEGSYWQSTWHCQSTLIASKCDRLDRAMLLSFLDSLGVFFVLATIGIVDCTFGCLPVSVPHPVPFPFFVHGIAVLFLSGQDRTERKRHRLLGCYCKNIQCQVLSYLVTNANINVGGF